MYFRVARRFALAALVSALTGGSAFSASDGPEIPFDIRADEIVYEESRDLYEATGNVVVTRADGATLEADWVSFSTKTQMGVAAGRVRILDDGDVVTADFAAINFADLTALANDASIDTPESGFRASGDVIQKTGPATYRIEQGRFTTCRCPDPEETQPWEIEAAEADLEIEGYAATKGVVFRAFDVPFLYLPYMLLPVKTKRQSGFLVPTYESDSENGYEFDFPFFWAVRPNLNLILHPSYLTKRGAKLGLEFESLIGERSWFEGNVGALPGDRAVDESDPETPYSDDRWGGWVAGHHPFAAGWNGQLNFDVAQVSDNDYVLDFSELADRRNDRFLHSSAWASLGKFGLVGSAELAWVDDLQSPTNLDRDDFLLQRLPDLRLLALPRQLGPLPFRLGLGARYTYFYQRHGSEIHNGITAIDDQFFDTGADGTFDAREPNPITGVFDGLDNHEDDFATFGGYEGDGLFQEGELLANSGQRIDLYPRLSVPLRAGPVETLTEIGIRETLYFTKEISSASRTLYTGRFDGRLRLQRSFEQGGRTLSHLIEPRASFTWISDESQDSNPLFIPMASVRPERLITFDSRILLGNQSDRIDPEKLLIVGVGNRIFSSPSGGGGSPRLVADLAIGSGYDFERSRVSTAFLEGSLYPNADFSLTAEVGYDFKDRELDEALLSLAWASGPGHTLSLNYRYLRQLPISFEDFKLDPAYEDFESSFRHVNQLALGASVAVLKTLDLFGGVDFDFEGNNALRSRAGFALHSTCDCWDLVVQAAQTTRPVTTRVSVELRLAGLGFGSETDTPVAR